LANSAQLEQRRVSLKPNFSRVTKGDELIALHRDLPFLQPEDTNHCTNPFEMKTSEFIFRTLVLCVEKVIEKYGFKEEEKYKIPANMLATFLAINFVCKHLHIKMLPQSEIHGVSRIFLPSKLVTAFFDLCKDGDEDQHKFSSYFNRILASYRTGSSSVLDTIRSDNDAKESKRWLEQEWKQYKPTFDGKLQVLVQNIETEIVEWNNQYDENLPKANNNQDDWKKIN